MTWNNHRYMRLKDKVAVVTGASSEIGISIVKRFVEEGAKVVLLGRKLDSLEKARNTISNKNATVSMQCDITDEAQVLQTVEQILNKYGSIDILVNSAGAINDPIHFHEMPDSEITKLIDVNMYGVFKMTKAIAVEYARSNVRCNCVNPGIINSGMIKPYLDDPQARKVLEDRLPLNRIGQLADIPNAALYLASDEANWITGTILNVDGGKTFSEG